MVHLLGQVRCVEENPRICPLTASYKVLVDFGQTGYFTKLLIPEVEVNMIQESKWTTTFQVTVPLLDMPKGFKRWQKTFLDRLLQEIELVREELGYEANTSAIDNLHWQLENRNKVRERMLEIMPKYWQPEDDEFVNLLETIFYEGIESSLTMSSLNALDFGGAAPLFF